MKFNELDDSDKQYFQTIYYNKELSWDTRISTLSTKFNCSTRTIDNWAKRLKITTPPEDSPQLKIAQAKEHNKKSKRFIITWAQNNTPVHKEFLNNLKAYSEFINADIHIIAGRYRNPTSMWTLAQENEESWASEVLPYLDANRHNIHKYVSIMSDVKIQPTAVNPMTGMEGLSGINSCIFGSPKVQMEMIPVLEGNSPKMMITTGACTHKNYTDSKSGKKGEFHHSLGFAIVEIKNSEVFFMRQVTANDDGSFCDLFYQVKDEKAERIDTISAIVWGDLHIGSHDEKVFNKTFELMEKLKPEHVILHDVFDGKSISHHEEKDPFLQYQKEVDGTNSLKGEIKLLVDWLSHFKNYNTVIVRSNHDDFVDRWLRNTDWRKTVTPKNSLEYMQYSSAILSGEARGGIIPWVINKELPNFITLDRSDSYIVNGWELGQHGDIGSGGSRGSLQQFRKLNTKIIVGHYHSPGRKDGALAVGTSTHLRVGYNIGASAWLQSHVIIHTNGKAQHINFIKGEYTTLI
jgi:hypothetical protein